MAEDKLFDGLETFIVAESGEVFDKTPNPIKAADEKKAAEALKNSGATDDNLIDITDVIKEEAKTATTTNTTDTNVDASKEGFKMLATYMKDNGVFVDEIDITDFDGDEEKFKELLAKNDEIIYDKAGNESISDLDPRLQDLIKKARSGVDFEALLETKRNQIKYSKIDPTKLAEAESLQEDIYKDYLRKTTQFSEEKINKEFNRVKDLGQLEEEVKEILPELKKFEDLKEAELVALKEQEVLTIQKQHQEAIDNYKKSIEALTEIAPGLKISKKDKESLFKSITTPVAQDTNGNPMSELAVERSKNPVSFDIKLHYLMKVTKGFTDFTPFIEAGKSKGLTELEGKLESQKQKTGQTGAGGLGELMKKALEAHGKNRNQ